MTFAERIQIDIADGELAPSQTINLNQLYWPKPDDRQAKIDLHLMLMRPMQWLDQIVSLAPDKIILHAESNEAAVNIPRIFEHLRRFGIEVGVALLPETQPDEVKSLLDISDTVLIFGGHLGYQGGVADLSQLDKIPAIKAINPEATIEWDGGASLENIANLVEAGVDQVNVGSAISSQPNAKAAYDEILAKLS